MATIEITSLPTAETLEATDWVHIKRGNGDFKMSPLVLHSIHTALTNPHDITKLKLLVDNVTNDAQLKIASNLQDLTDIGVARTKLSVYSQAEIDVLLAAHADLTNNPHGVTKTQVGLSNVTNAAQLTKAGNLSGLASKAVSRTTLDVHSKAEVAALIAPHVDRTDNPHGVTKTQVGLSNVGNFTISDDYNGGSPTTYASTAATKALADLISAAAANLVPQYAIFYIAVDQAIPAGYALCDGSNGTPNLIGRFVRSSTEDDDGATGGFDSIEHNHTINSESVALTIAQIPSHDHPLEGAVAYSVPTAREAFHPKRGHHIQFSSKTQATGGGQAHSHGASSAPITHDNRPGFMNLKPIMKLT